MAPITTTQAGTPTARATKQSSNFWESQKLAKQKAYEKKAKKKKIKLMQLAVFTNQLASMLEAGLPLVAALEALQDQTEDPVFQIIIRDVKNDVASGTSFSDAVRKFPRAFPNLFVAMVEAGEASGGLANLLAKVALYFEDTVKLMKQVKGAMVYPALIIGLAVVLINVLMLFVVPVFASLFNDFGAKLPMPTMILLNSSDFLKHNFVYMIIGLVILVVAYKKFTATPKGRRIKDQVLFAIPILGTLIQKISVSRFCRTYAVLMRSGVPILRTLEIVSSASGNTYIEMACKDFQREISQGGQLSEIISVTPYFPAMVMHMCKAGEQTGDVDGMMNKVSDFYDDDIDNQVAALTSMMEPLIIVFLGLFVGFIVGALFMPLFMLGSVVG